MILWMNLASNRIPLHGIADAINLAPLAKAEREYTCHEQTKQ